MEGERKKRCPKQFSSPQNLSFCPVSFFSSSLSYLGYVSYLSNDNNIRSSVAIKLAVRQLVLIVATQVFSNLVILLSWENWEITYHCLTYSSSYSIWLMLHSRFYFKGEMLVLLNEQ